MKDVNKIIIVSHLDDTEFGLFNTIKKFKKSDKVLVYIASSGLYKHSKKINKLRRHAQIHNLKKLFKNVKIIINSKKMDTLFFKYKKEIREHLEKYISKYIKKDRSKIDLITLAPDIHEDHRILSELVDIIARPDINLNKFKNYFKFKIPINKKFEDFNLYTSTFNFISCKESKIKSKKKKLKLLNNYPTETINIGKLFNEIIYKIY